MTLPTDSDLFSLATGEVVSIDDAAGKFIAPRFGTLWVTQEDCAVDHIVKPGDVLVIAKPGRTVVQALAPARFAVRETFAANDPTQTAA
jgi:hypothetical protein